MLREELAGSADSDSDERQAELDQLTQEEAQIDRALYQQALRLEEHDDPNHPVVALAKQRIEELSARRNAVAERTKQLRAARPEAPSVQLAALLDSVPDLRPIMKKAAPEQLTELFAAFDLMATYDKDGRALPVAATLNPALMPTLERPRPPKEAVGEIVHSGGRI